MDDVDAGFLSLALGTDVTRLEIVDRVEGTTGRVRLVAHTAEGRAVALFVKAPARRRRARVLAELPSLTRAEVRFYDELAPGLAAVPRRYFVGHRRGRFAVVLEDLTDRFVTHDGAHGWTVAEAQAVLDAVAEIHSRHLGDTALRPGAPLEWLTRMRRREDRLGDVAAVPLVAAGLRRAGDLVPGHLRGPLRRHARRRRHHMAALAEGSPTVVHADCHPGNVALARTGPPRAVLCDWQLVRSAPWTRDVGYMLATGLEPAVRRAHGTELVERHHRRLATASGPVGDLAEAHLAVRANTVVALEAMVVTLGVGGLMDDAVIETLVTRTASAVDDLDGFDALATLVARRR